MRGAALVLFSIAACSAPPAMPTQTPDPTAQQVEIRTDPLEGCMLQGLGPARLEGDPQAPLGEQVWVVWLREHPRIEVGSHLWPVWPHGSTANFAPELRILNQDGTVLVSEGQTFISGGRLDGSDYHICMLTVSG